ncbi:nitrate ABC transporter substrate-binding protein [Verminephrobacter aporrectodeae subsp. tuberculatae]|uniref:nitrate ABC transporter substrate-binding protein n=1 Tax=Verminephrobacter aporrectodeae TaxID=1110389 RepID=UPI0022383363|nr:nitrate ABC transporter substrate-binding protein [Verminephrobacter aporrectodeae]MCW5219742.1 nitrate ABC transporter substrate-binding protein [Verminephrobacter aporrectodeae subsp. tuberculatae]MCW5287560.1 nitrate ABC transporter substrate-binding protein [Verminephrobacter aporrectodeae subsp. tuberculatae]MCW8163994.1 nitrate ABC transporter substrate-binding protein [Verminephrobacter aporrectodeae subsp. tuberculatae]MCW8168692.1 nitrate ABC transporter substrate-binding protein [V
MTKTVLRLAVRDWDYLTPLALGDLRSSEVQVELHRVGTLPEDLAADPRYDAGEISFSRYAQARARGDEAIVGVPHFLMRAFRHRCIITAAQSPWTQIGQLAGKRIGLTGWQDSGNVWTRAILRQAGIGMADAQWFVGRLTAAHPVVDRLHGHGQAGHIEAVADERPLVDLLHAGALDAVFTPFMPPGFFEPACGLRPLLPHCRQAEVDYFRTTGYVPGIHVLGIRKALVQAWPGLPQALSELLDEAARLWLEKRRKYADTTPWIIDELQQTARDLPDSWNRNGFVQNEQMIADFGKELHAQRITQTCLSPRELFPLAGQQQGIGTKDA